MTWTASPALATLHLHVIIKRAPTHFEDLCREIDLHLCIPSSSTVRIGLSEHMQRLTLKEDCTISTSTSRPAHQTLRTIVQDCKLSKAKGAPKLLVKPCRLPRDPSRLGMLLLLLRARHRLRPLKSRRHSTMTTLMTIVAPNACRRSWS